MKAWEKAGLTKEQGEIAKVFPGLLDLSIPQALTLYRDDHSLFRGEAKRARRQKRYIDEYRKTFGSVEGLPGLEHERLLMHLHDFYVGDVRQADRQTMPMYHGGGNDFPANREIFRLALRDVDHVYEHLVGLLPEEVSVGKRRFRLRERLAIAHEVRSEDLLDLLQLAKSKDRRIRHQARCRLILAQTCFGARRDGFAPDELHGLAKDFRSFVGRAFFADSLGEPVHIVAELDPHDGYVCKSYQIVEHDRPVPDPASHRFILPAFRQTVPRRRKENRPPLQIFFFLRHKERMLLKQLDKKIVFPQIMGIGDPIAMMFVVEREDVERLVPEVREILVPCPGMVADMNSTFGHRLGSERLDPRNQRSSKLYEALKYVARMQDRMVEVQFLPMAAWINAHAARSDVNHAWYKMKRYLGSAYPTLFPDTWTGVPWSDIELQIECIQHAISADSRVTRHASRDMASTV